MSYLVLGFSVGAFEAHNWTHTQLADLSAVGPSFPHNDGVDYDHLGTADRLLTNPTTLSQAVDTFNAAKALLHRHYTRYSTGRRLYAHKAQDTTNLIATADMASGASYEATILAALIALLAEEGTDYEAHRLETGGNYHATDDAVNVLGTTSPLVTFQDCAERANLLKALLNAHFADGTFHGASTTAISSANAVGTNIDSIITLANEIRTRWATHIASGAAHQGADGDDAANTITTAAVTYPADLFTLAGTYKTGHNAHLGSTTFHEVADSTNTLGYSNPTTIAGLITAAQEVYADLNAHIAFAPKSAALRSS